MDKIIDDKATVVVATDVEKDETKEKEEKKTKVIGSGFWGTIYCPAPSYHTKSAQKFTNTDKIVLKVTTQKAGLQAVRVSNHVKHSWIQANSNTTTSTMDKIGQLSKKLTPDDFFILVKPHVRDMTKFPTDEIDAVRDTTDPLRIWFRRFGLIRNVDLVGLYMNHGGVTWNKFFETMDEKTTITERDIIKIIRHLLVAVILLHRCNISHSDIHGGNVMIHPDDRLPRLIDWESAVIHRPEDDAQNQKMHHQVISDMTWWAILFGGRWNYPKQKQMEYDWLRVSAMLRKTWPCEGGVVGTSETRYKLISQMMEFEPTDVGAARAWLFLDEMT